jgi:hypothetical protein
VSLLLGSVLAGVAFAGQVILHPNGFGEHSYAAWRAQSGLPDTAGNKDQSLYFQKRTSTMTFAAGVATFQGIEGLPAQQLTGLSFYRGTDGHCGAGAPRFNIRVQPPSGPAQTFFIGCAGMAPGDTQVSPSGRTFEKRSVSFPAGFLPAGVITALSIVFDEGDDVGQGFVHLDDITVATTSALGTMRWTSASDNGNE